MWEKYILWNPYQYLMGDPVNKVDGDGLFVKNSDGSFKEKKQNQDGYDEVFLIAEEKNNGKTVKIAAQRLDSKGTNCIGFATTDTLDYFIEPSTMPLILEFDNYSKVDDKNKVKEGHIVVFSTMENGKQSIQHAGIVSKVEIDKEGNVTNVLYDWTSPNQQKPVTTSVISNPCKNEGQKNPYGELGREYYEKK